MNTPYFLAETPRFSFQNNIDPLSVCELDLSFDQDIRNLVHTKLFIAKFMDLPEIQRYRFLTNMQKILNNTVSLDTILVDSYQQVIFCILMQYYFSI